MVSFAFDELACSIGQQDLKINDSICVHVPTIREIMDFGENIYWNLISVVTRRPYDVAVELWEKGIDYQSISNYDLFIESITYFPLELTSILFGELDFSSFQLCRNTLNDQRCLVCKSDPSIIIDEALYCKIVSFVRYTHFLSEKVEVDAANQAAKKFLIDRMRRKRKKYLRDLELGKIRHTSPIADLIKFCVNHPGFKYDYSSVLDLKINLLYESFYTIQHLDNREQLITGIYGGTIDVSKLNDKNAIQPIVDLHVK